MDIEKDFSRNVWCLLGLPFDAVNLVQAAEIIRTAISKKEPCFLSTPNLNFLCAAQDDQAFKESVINSDLSVADGFPIVVLAKWLGIPLPERVAGSDLIDHLYRNKTDKPIKVYFFGGAPGTGEIACQVINAQPSGLNAVGHFAPGFGSVEDMATPEMIADINRHKPDFVIVALGAKKGQAWIENNRFKLNAQVISHLGAVINFFAGTVQRAPTLVQRLGLEWLWRIYQEPTLWRRYANDGLKLINLIIFNVLPYWLWQKLHQNDDAIPQSVAVSQLQTNGLVQITLTGRCTKANLTQLNPVLKEAAKAKRDTVLDLNNVSLVDSAFLGYCLLLYKHLKASGHTLKLANPNSTVKRIIRWQKVNDLLV